MLQNMHFVASVLLALANGFSIQIAVHIFWGTEDGVLGPKKISSFANR